MIAHDLETPESSPALSQAEAIEALLARLETAARQERSSTEFFQQLLQDLVGALSATSGAVWSESEGGLTCLEQIGATGTENRTLAEAAERRIVAAVLLEGEPRMIAPGGVVPGSEESNASECLQCLSPAQGEGVPGVVLRIGLRPEASLGERETAGGLVSAAADIALSFQIQHRLRELARQETFWKELDDAVLKLNATRKLSDCARTIAEQVRRLLGSDRASLLVRRGRRCRLSAVSSATDPDRRARQVRLLEQLATEAVQSSTAFEAQVGSGASPLRLSASVDQYLDETQLRTIRCAPLFDPLSDAEPPVGCLVVDSFSGEDTDLWDRQLDALAPHCAQALQRALHEQARGWRRFLNPWRALSRAAVWSLLTAAVIGAVVALIVVPADFTVEANGRLMPAERRGVFAPDDAIIAELMVEDGSLVKAGDSLARLVDSDLELEVSRLQGELQTAAAQLDAVQARRKLRLRDRDIDTSLLSIEEEELRASVAGLERQLDVIEQQRRRLTVVSPLNGRVARWDLKETLQSLPVRHGQRLMDVYRPDGAWRLELDVPDDVAGYVRLADDDGTPRVDYIFQTEPGRVLTARLDQLADATDLDAEGNLTVRGTVNVPDGAIASPQRGATVTAKIHCGRRPLGFVWFREVVEFIQRRVLF